MSAMSRAIGWPIVSLLVIGGTHLVAEAIRPELHEVIGPAVVIPIYLLVGGWVGFGVARAGGGFVGGIIAGAAVGLMPAILQVVGFGMILGRDGASAATSGLFGFLGLLWGGALGAGIGTATTDVAPATERSHVPTGATHEAI